MDACILYCMQSYHLIRIFREKFTIKEQVNDGEILAQLGLSERERTDASVIASGTSYDIAQI